MPTLTSLLARDAIVSLDVVEQALQRQVLDGGEIDTALLELAAVPENVLSAYRAASFDLPPAARAQLEHIEPGLIARVPAKIAREFRVVPIALERELLVLAADAPLQGLESQRLAAALGTRVTFRITTELRASAALHQHYDVELPERLAKLAQRLRSVSPGELCEVRQSTPSREPIAFRHRVSARPPDSGLRVPREGGIAEAVRRVSASMPPPASATTPSQMAVATVLGATDSSDPTETRPERRSRPAPGQATGTAQPQASATNKSSSTLRVPRGPFTWQQAVEFLNEAHDRDRVLEIFFGFARQYFDCSVLFVVRDDTLFPFRSAGLAAAADDEGVSLRLLSGGAVFSTAQMLAARVADLRGHSSDAALLGAIGRARFQPCALVPIAIRKRMIGLLYGDRAGEPLELSDFSDVLPLVPNIGAAFERIIQDRKRNAAEGRPEPTPSAHAPEPAKAAEVAKAPEVVKAPEVAKAPEAAAPTVAGPTVPARPPRAPTPAYPVAPAAAYSVPAGSGRTMPPARVMSEASSATASADIALQPTMQMPTGSSERARSLAPPPARPGSYSERTGSEERIRAERREASKTQPQRPSRISEPKHQSVSIGRVSLAPPPRMLSHAPQGSGSYSLRPQAAQRESMHPDDPTDRPPPMTEEQADADKRVSSGPKTLPSIVVTQPSADAERLADELQLCTPEQGQEQIAALLRLGDDGLRALQRRFPGTLWFDRTKPRHRIPSGHDVSAIARGVRAFEERAVPVVAELIGAPQPDARMSALLLAAERPRSALIWPLYQRLFDADGQVRVMALEVLPRFRSLAEFMEVLSLLRERAADDREPIPSRLSALEAIGALRDGASVELLLKLSHHGNRQLSVPAHRSLLLITAQDFGDSDRKWKAWLDKNRKRPRVEWLIDSLMHGDERVRNTAGLELQKLTQVYYGFVASSSKRDRERAQQRYRDWLRQQGKVPTLA